MPKRKGKFSNELKKEFPYLRESDEGKVHCSLLVANLSFLLVTAVVQMSTIICKAGSTKYRLKRWKFQKLLRLESNQGPSDSHCPVFFLFQIYCKPNNHE